MSKQPCTAQQHARTGCPMQSRTWHEHSIDSCSSRHQHALLQRANLHMQPQHAWTNSSGWSSTRRGQTVTVTVLLQYKRCKLLYMFHQPARQLAHISQRCKLIQLDDRSMPSTRSLATAVITMILGDAGPTTRRPSASLPPRQQMLKQSH